MAFMLKLASMYAYPARDAEWLLLTVSVKMSVHDLHVRAHVSEPASASLEPPKEIEIHIDHESIKYLKDHHKLDMGHAL